MFTYATISPIILPVGAFYFLAALLVYKKQLLLVFTPTYESGGIMFPTACRRTLIGLMCGQITLIGYTVLRMGFYQVCQGGMGLLRVSAIDILHAWVGRLFFLFVL